MQTNRNNVGPLIGGAILIGIGLLSLIARLVPGLDMGNLWPLFIITLGALFFLAMFAMGKSGAGLAVPGTIISGIGLILLYQAITDKWQSMSYFWALIVFFVGLGIYIMGQYGEDAIQKKSGMRVMKIGIILFIVFGVFFESLFSSLNSMIFPILLILLGGYLVLSRSGLLGSKQGKSNDTQLPPTS
jgi:quinol-cytochrome oxidoreductase complex cytochrome b subunit